MSDVPNRRSEPDDESVRLAMDNTAMSMASRGKRVWEPARTEDSDRIAALYDALRVEWFERVLPDLDFETERGEPGWREHPWFVLLNLTDDECVEVLQR